MKVLDFGLARVQERRISEAETRSHVALRSLLSSPQLPATTGRESSAAGERPSVAVLPFVNLSADPEQEYFCDGMAVEIINALAPRGIPTRSLVSRSPARRGA